MKILRTIIVTILSVLLISCASMNTAEQNVTNGVITTISDVVKSSLATVCALPQPIANSAIMTSINGVIAPDNLTIGCSTSTTALITANTNVVTLSKFEVTALKAVTTVYCADPILGAGILNGLNIDIAPIVISVSCH